MFALRFCLLVPAFFGTLGTGFGGFERRTKTSLVPWGQDLVVMNGGFLVPWGDDLMVWGRAGVITEDVGVVVVSNRSKDGM